MKKKKKYEIMSSYSFKKDTKDLCQKNNNDLKKMICLQKKFEFSNKE